MLVSGLWKRHTKWRGTSYLAMGDSSGNKVFVTWEKLWMLPMRMFLTNLTQYGVSKVSLLLVAICRLLGRLDPKWALFLESLWFCAGFPEVTCAFLFQLNWFSICAQKRYSKYHNLRKIKFIVESILLGIK